MREQDLVERDAAAEILGLSVRTLERWARAGYGPRVLKIRRRVRYLRSEVETWNAKEIEAALAVAA